MNIRNVMVVLILASLPCLAGFDNEILAVFFGEQAQGGRFGSALLGVGDVDGNGVSDFVIGDHDFEDPGLFNQGRAYLFLSYRHPLRFERIVLPGGPDRGLYGKEISALGDLDGDGLHEFSVTSENQRQVDIFFGRRAWPWIEKSTLVAPPGVRTTDTSAVGDLNGDGYQDILVEALFPGIVYVISWPIRWNLHTAPTLSPEIPGLGTITPGRARGLGDVDLDGLPDFVVTGGLRVDGQTRNHALLYRGQPGAFEAMNPSASVELYPVTQLGFYEPVLVPDLDGDGRPEVLVSERIEGVQNLVAFGYRGPGQWVRTGQFIASNPAQLGFGGIVADFDYDGDGHWDILFRDGYSAPNLRLYRGPFPDGQVAESSFVPTSRGLEPSFGASNIANVGDIDGDGLEDLLVGANEPLGRGSAVLLRGGATRALNIDVAHGGDQGNGRMGYKLSAQLEGSSSGAPALVTSLELTFRGALWPYTDVSEARIQIIGPWELSTSVDRSLLMVRLTSAEGVSIDESASGLLHVLARPDQNSGILLDLVDASATLLDGRPIWVTADEASFHKVTAPADYSRPGRPRGSLSASSESMNSHWTFSIGAPESGTIRLKVFDMRGRRVWERTFEVAERGVFEVPWNGMDLQGTPVGSGVYAAQVAGRGWHATAKVVLVR